MKRVKLSEVKDRFSEYLRMAEDEEIIVTRHGKPAGLLVGFATEDDWIDYRIEHDPRFVRRIAEARQSLRQGKGVRIEDLSEETG
ncbi:MAG: type II toxin-antitoxin system Phd/YefM family antitoxin [Anaerolineae bacterium]|jgi:prevent-host-death family protein